MSPLSSHFSELDSFGHFLGLWKLLDILDSFEQFWSDLDTLDSFGKFWTLWTLFDTFSTLDSFGQSYGSKSCFYLQILLR